MSSLCFGQSESKPSTDGNVVSVKMQPIKGWRMSTEFKHRNYAINLDANVRHGGNFSVSLKSKSSADEDKRKNIFLMQTIKGENYRGKKLRLSAFVKSENVEHAALWMRMDGDGMKVLNLDTMDNRPINGTVDWQKYEIILDVPTETRQIVFGLALKGSGQVWLDDINLEEVSFDTPGTSVKLPAEWEKGSTKRIEQYKTTNKEDYDKQLKAFAERSVTASSVAANLDFEN